MALWLRVIVVIAAIVIGMAVGALIELQGEK